MAKLRNTIHLDAPIDRVWSIVGTIERPETWIPGIAGVVVEGDRRVCTFADGSVQHERISNHDAASHSYAYAIESGPLPLKTNRGRFLLEPNGGGTTLQWDAELEAADPEQEAGLVRMLDGMYKQVLGNVKRLAESPARVTVP